MKFLYYAGVVLALLICFAILNFTVETFGVSSQSNFFGDDSAVWHVIASMLAMLVGVVFGTIYRYIIANSSQNNIGSILKNALTGRDIILSIVVSPLVFSVVYMVTKDNPLSGTSLFLMFENGFFCQAVFSKKFAARHDAE